MTKKKNKLVANKLDVNQIGVKPNAVDIEVKKKIDKIYTDLVIISEMLAKDGTREFCISTYFSEIKFTFGEGKKK